MAHMPDVELLVAFNVESKNLNDAQMARIAALQAARNVLQQTPGDYTGTGAVGSVQIHEKRTGTCAAPDAIDLINVAQFVLTGEDPYVSFKAVD